MRSSRSVPRSPPGSSRCRRATSLGEERLDAPRARRRPELAPGAVLGVLVGPPADELRAVAEAVALHLVVAHLDHELRPDARLLEPAAAPAVRLGRSASPGPPRRAAAPSARPRRASSPRPRTSRRSRARRRRDRGPSRSVATSSRDSFQRIPATTQSALLCSFTLTTPSREPGRYGAASRFATTPSSPSDSKRSSHPRASFERARGGREPEARRDALELGAPLLERPLPDRLALPDEHVEHDVLTRGSRPTAS